MPWFWGVLTHYLIMAEYKHNAITAYKIIIRSPGLRASFESLGVNDL